MNIPFPTLSDETLGAIADQIDKDGFGVAVNCIDPQALAPLQKDIEKTVDAAGRQYVVFTGRENIQDPFLRELGNSPEFNRAIRTIYEKGTGKRAPAIPFYQVLRCLAGSRGENESYIFHYDSYVVTALVPIIIPTEGMPGDLIMLPNARKIRKTYLGNLIDKLILDNRLSQVILRKLILSGLIKSTKIRMSPGNVYFFWGCRSIHANEPCDQDKVRATALYHYVDPHAESRLRQWLRPQRRQLAIEAGEPKMGAS
jgi:hypothetical protein